MGESWNQKVGKRYRHHVQLKTVGFTSPNLFDDAEQIEKQYFGHLESEATGLEVGAFVNLFMFGKRCRPALAVGKDVIGYVEGESAADIHEQVKGQETWPVLLRMKIVRKDPNSNTIVISPSAMDKTRKNP